MQGSRRRGWNCWLAAAVALHCLAQPALLAGPANPRAVLRQAQSRVVKLFGAGGLQGLEAYQTGLLVSAEGHVVTINTSVLDTGQVTVVTIDGARRAGEVLVADPIADVALLKIDPAGEQLPFWDLAVSPTTAAGNPAWALANEFGIATGNEPVTVLQGVVAARTPLRGVVGASRLAAPRESLLLDMVTSNPGAAGGAVIDVRGRLLGMIGREMRSELTGAWVSHAIPTDELDRVITDLVNGSAANEGLGNLRPAIDLLQAWGFALAPSVGQRTPPYVDYVRPGSPADSAGLRADDLVVLWQGSVAATRHAALRLAGGHQQPVVTVTVKRGDALLDLTIDPLGESPMPRTKDPIGK